MAAADPGSIAALLAPYPTALLVTRGEDGHLRCRPMAMRHAVRGEEIWFAATADGGMCKDLAHDPRCALAFLDPEGGTSVSVAGRGEVLRDRKLTEALWDPSWTRWFPRGPEHHRVVLVRVLPELVERRDAEGGRATVVLDARRHQG
jgi:general stress protein 26